MSDKELTQGQFREAYILRPLAEKWGLKIRNRMLKTGNVDERNRVLDSHMMESYLKARELGWRGTAEKWSQYVDKVMTALLERAKAKKAEDEKAAKEKPDGKTD